MYVYQEVPQTETVAGELGQLRPTDDFFTQPSEETQEYSGLLGVFVLCASQLFGLIYQLTTVSSSAALLIPLFSLRGHLR